MHDPRRSGSVASLPLVESARSLGPNCDVGSGSDDRGGFAQTLPTTGPSLADSVAFVAVPFPIREEVPLLLGIPGQIGGIEAWCVEVEDDGGRQW